MEKEPQLQEGCRGHSGHLPVQCAASPRPCGCGEPQTPSVVAQKELPGATSGPTAEAEAASPAASSPRPAQGLEDVCLPARPPSCQLTGPQPLVDAVGRKPGVTPTRMVSPEQCRQVALAHCLAALCSHLRFPDHLPLDKPQIPPPLGGLPASLWRGLALLTPVLTPFP